MIRTRLATRKLRKSQAGFSSVELAAMLAVIALLALIVGMPVLKKRSKAVMRAQCVNNLKGVGLAFRIYSTDSSDDFATARLVKGGIDPAAINTLQIFRLHSNELSSPKVLRCPSDTERTVAGDFQNLTAANISYFTSLSAEETLPQAFLAGDRNWTIKNVPVGTGQLLLTTNTAIGWTEELHNEEGNIVMGDGSVQKMNVAGVNQAKLRQELATNYLVFP